MLIGQKLLLFGVFFFAHKHIKALAFVQSVLSQKRTHTVYKVIMQVGGELEAFIRAVSLDSGKKAEITLLYNIVSRYAVM